MSTIKLLFLTTSLTFKTKKKILILNKVEYIVRYDILEAKALDILPIVYTIIHLFTYLKRKATPRGTRKRKLMVMLQYGT